MWTGWPPVAKSTKLPCDCCGHKTVEKLGEAEICPVCWWTEDQIARENVYYPIAVNNGVSLNQARENYKDFNAYQRGRLKFVRPPTVEEKGDGK